MIEERTWASTPELFDTLPAGADAICLLQGVDPPHAVVIDIEPAVRAKSDVALRAPLLVEAVAQKPIEDIAEKPVEDAAAKPVEDAAAKPIEAASEPPAEPSQEMRLEFEPLPDPNAILPPWIDPEDPLQDPPDRIVDEAWLSNVGLADIETTPPPPALSVPVDRLGSALFREPAPLHIAPDTGDLIPMDSLRPAVCATPPKPEPTRVDRIVADPSRSRPVPRDDGAAAALARLRSQAPQISARSIASVSSVSAISALYSGGTAKTGIDRSDPSLPEARRHPEPTRYPRPAPELRRRSVKERSRYGKPEAIVDMSFLARAFEIFVVVSLGLAALAIELRIGRSLELTSEAFASVRAIAYMAVGAAAAAALRKPSPK